MARAFEDVEDIEDMFEEIVSLGLPLSEISQDRVDKLFKDGDCLFSKYFSKQKCKTGFEMGSLLNEQGKQSKVYRSKCENDDSYVAKLYEFKYKKDTENVLKEVINQIKILNLDLINPIAPKIYEILMCKNQSGEYRKAIIIMDILDGDSLETHLIKLLRNNDRRQILNILFKVKETFSKLYNSGWAHGDVHTNNIFVTKFGKVYLLDFDRSSYISNKKYLEDLKKIEIENLMKFLSDLLGQEYKQNINEIFRPLLKGVEVFTLSQAVSRGAPDGKRTITFRKPEYSRKDSDDEDSYDQDKPRSTYLSKPPSGYSRRNYDSEDSDDSKEDDYRSSSRTSKNPFLDDL